MSYSRKNNTDYLDFNESSSSYSESQDIIIHPPEIIASAKTYAAEKPSSFFYNFFFCIPACFKIDTIDDNEPEKNYLVRPRK